MLTKIRRNSFKQIHRIEATDVEESFRFKGDALLFLIGLKTKLLNNKS